ncbi:MAG TPA: hemerythrin domain-containing protein [Solimonas sp.]
MSTHPIYNALRESHELQRSLCRKLLRSKPGTAERQQLFRELRIELAAHAAAEERFLYAPMMMDDMGLDSSRHALAEHHRIDECVEDLQKAEEENGSWMAKAKKLSHEVHHHLREEEKKFFQVSGKILSNTQKKRLASQYRRDYERMHRSLAAS